MVVDVPVEDAYGAAMVVSGRHTCEMECTTNAK